MLATRLGTPGSGMTYQQGIDFLSSETAFARLLLWIRFPHLNTPHSLRCLQLHTVEERLNFAICLCLENGGVL